MKNAFLWVSHVLWSVLIWLTIPSLNLPPTGASELFSNSSHYQKINLDRIFLTLQSGQTILESQNVKRNKIFFGGGEGRMGEGDRAFLKMGSVAT